MVEFNDFRVLFTPRTGSRSLEAFLLDKGGKNVGIHHTQPDRVPITNKPNYVVTREPHSQLESWYHAVNSHTKYSLEEFLTHYGRMGKFKPLNTYMHILRPMDKVFLFEDGLEEIAIQMGFTFGIEKMPHIGESKDKCTWTDKHRELVERYFKEDLEFYKSVIVARAKQLMLDNQSS